MFRQSPVDERKSGIPLSVDIPAPVSTTASRARAIASAKRGSGHFSSQTRGSGTGSPGKQTRNQGISPAGSAVRCRTAPQIFDRNSGCTSIGAYSSQGSSSKASITSGQSVHSRLSSPAPPPPTHQRHFPRSSRSPDSVIIPDDPSTRSRVSFAIAFTFLDFTRI